MADNSMFDTPDSPPPPAYEFCQQEFDQKVSHAIEESNALPPPQSSGGDDEWEVWDDAAFTAAVARLGLSEGSSSSAAAPPPPQPAAPRKFMQDAIDVKVSEVQPLRIAKKARSPSPKREKERPSWYAEAQLGEHAPSASSQSAAPSNGPPPPSLPPQPVYQEREPTPPPVFEAVGPSLDGPPYEGPPQVVLSYNPPAPGSRPESPLQSPLSPPTRYDYQLPPPQSPPPPPQQQHYQPQPQYQQYQQPQHQRTLPVPAPRQTPSPRIPSPPASRYAHQSLPPPTKPVQKMGPRPITTYNPSTRAPHLAFNPQVAYTRKVQTHQSEEDQLPSTVDASAFYNSSVASLSSGPRRAPTQPQHRATYNQPPPVPSPPAAPVQQPVQSQQQQQPVGGYQYTNHNYGGYNVVPAQQQYNPYQQPVQQYPQQHVATAPGVVVTQTWAAPNPYMGQQYGRGW